MAVIRGDIKCLPHMLLKCFTRQCLDCPNLTDPSSKAHQSELTKPNTTHTNLIPCDSLHASHNPATLSDTCLYWERP